MQLTTLSGGGTTRRTGDGGYLFGREFPLLHLDRMQLHASANLYNLDSASSHKRNHRTNLELEANGLTT